MIFKSKLALPEHFASESLRCATSAVTVVFGIALIIINGTSIMYLCSDYFGIAPSRTQIRSKTIKLGDNDGQVL